VHIHEFLPHVFDLGVFLAQFPGEFTGQCPHPETPTASALGHLDALALNSGFVLDAGDLVLQIDNSRFEAFDHTHSRHGGRSRSLVKQVSQNRDQGGGGRTPRESISTVNRSGQLGHRRHVSRVW
jgi:hypothetical protein